jgi:hypothetical protein
MTALLKALGAPEGEAEYEIPEWLAELLEGEDEVTKAAGHKYIRREPTGNPKRPWRYFYKVQHGGGAGGAFDIKEGAAFKVSHGGKEGHFHVLKVEGDQVTIRHDESGHEGKVPKGALRAMFAKEHAGAIESHREKLKRELSAAEKTGTPKQRERLAKEAAAAGVAPKEETKWVMSSGVLFKDADPVPLESIEGTPWLVGKAPRGSGWAVYIRVPDNGAAPVTLTSTKAKAKAIAETIKEHNFKSLDDREAVLALIREKHGNDLSRAGLDAIDRHERDIFWKRGAAESKAAAEKAARDQEEAREKARKAPALAEAFKEYIRIPEKDRERGSFKPHFVGDNYDLPFSTMRAAFDGKRSRVVYGNMGSYEVLEDVTTEEVEAAATRLAASIKENEKVRAERAHEDKKKKDRAERRDEWSASGLEDVAKQIHKEIGRVEDIYYKMEGAAPKIDLKEQLSKIAVGFEFGTITADQARSRLKQVQQKTKDALGEAAKASRDQKNEHKALVAEADAAGLDTGTDESPASVHEIKLALERHRAWESEMEKLRGSGKPLTWREGDINIATAKGVEKKRGLIYGDSGVGFIPGATSLTHLATGMRLTGLPANQEHAKTAVEAFHGHAGALPDDVQKLRTMVDKVRKFHEAQQIYRQGNYKD